ncbi:MAG TPA: glycosyltransferase family 9 protein [Candidatus Eisenbacteria bacterium]|jgi:ADP-heptose:LPS heptosyltransferase
MSASPLLDPAGVRRVLLIRPRFLGDICLTLPALDAVRTACPGTRIAYLVEREAAPLLEGDDRVEELIVVPRRPSAAATFETARRLRRLAPDLTLDFFCNPRTALWAWASGARIRVGYPDKGWRSALYTHHVRPRTLSAVGFHLASVAALGWPAPHRVPRLRISPAALAEARQALERRGVPRAVPLVGFHPGARWPTRRWELANYVELARRFLAQTPEGWALLTGGPGEDELVGEALAALPGGRAMAAVAWPIARFVALQSQCSAFVCGDTGPLHTAVAAGTPTLGILSRNRPAMFFPYPESLGHRAYYAAVECSPCHRDVCSDLRCLHRLTVDGAWRLLSGMLHRSEPGATPPSVRALALPPEP